MTKLTKPVFRARLDGQRCPEPEANSGQHREEIRPIFAPSEPAVVEAVAAVVVVAAAVVVVGAEA